MDEYDGEFIQDGDKIKADEAERLTLEMVKNATLDVPDLMEALMQYGDKFKEIVGQLDERTKVSLLAKYMYMSGEAYLAKSLMAFDMMQHPPVIKDAHMYNYISNVFYLDTIKDGYRPARSMYMYGGKIEEDSSPNVHLHAQIKALEDKLEEATTRAKEANARAEEANTRAASLEQDKASLEQNISTLHQQHQKEQVYGSKCSTILKPVMCSPCFLLPQMAYFQKDDVILDLCAGKVYGPKCSTILKPVMCTSCFLLPQMAYFQKNDVLSPDLCAGKTQSSADCKTEPLLPATAY